MLTRTTNNIGNGIRGTSTPRTWATRLRLSRGLQRLGGVAGLLVPAALAVAVYSTAVNGPNLRSNIAPTRSRARLVLQKAADHSVRRVLLRKL